MWPATKKHFTRDTFALYVEGLHWTRWRPSLIVLHNTAAPTWAQWHETAEKDRLAGRVPGTTRIANLEKYFRDQQHWSGCPHLFIPDDFIWEMNPLTAPGVHSPSWNNTAIGIEMVADFDREDDETGPGLKVRNNTIYATALLCSTLGLDPRKQVKLHKEDPKTTHACPGIKFARDRHAVIEEIVSMMDGGDHDPGHVSDSIDPKPVEPKPTKHGKVIVDDLTVRRGPGVTNEKIGSLPKGLDVEILDTASNGSDGWLKVKTPGGYIGWIAGRYVAQA